MMANSGNVMESMVSLIERLTREYIDLHNSAPTHLILGLEDLRLLRHAPGYVQSSYTKEQPTDTFKGLAVIITWEKHGIMVGKPWYVQGI